MIVHRDYMNSGDSSVKIYDDHIEFFNFGKLPEEISIDQLINGDYTSRVRNKKIASVFKEAQLIEKYGSGIKRIQEGFIQYGLKEPTFEEFQGGFRVRVFAKKEKSSEKGSEKRSEKSSEWILRLIAEKPEITIKELAIELKLSTRAIEKQITRLKINQKILRVGPDNGGLWEIIEMR